METARFDALSSFSGKLHGHKYVLPVAVWLSEEAQTRAVAQPEIRKGIVHAESNRIFEALERLVSIGAVRELPKTAGRRYFETCDSPYWGYVEALVRRLAGADRRPA
jgi:hypothetical protein